MTNHSPQPEASNSSPDDLLIAISDYKKAGGRWPVAYDNLAKNTPEFARAVLRFLSLSQANRRLDVKTEAFIQVALTASVTNLDPIGLRHSLTRAFELGATRDELLEVLALVSVLGIHSATVNVPIVVEEMKAAGLPIELKEIDTARRELADQYLIGSRYWDYFRDVFGDFIDGLLVLDPQMFVAFMEFTNVPWQMGNLELKVKELIYVAIDVATTHLYTDGARFHIRNALAFGATPDELLEVIEIATVLSFRSLELALPIIEDIENSLKKNS
jgi:alkylhydroperoxidase/carboxymuconolactone decarboxylase family protein YurZ